MFSITPLFLSLRVDLNQLPAAHPAALSPLPLNMTVDVGKHDGKTPGPRWRQGDHLRTITTGLRWGKFNLLAIK